MFPQLLVQECHFFGIVPSLSCTVGESVGEFGESGTSSLVGEESFVGDAALDDGRGRKTWRAGCGWVEADIGLLDGFESALDGSCSEVDCRLGGMGEKGGEEGELVDIEGTESLA